MRKIFYLSACIGCFLSFNSTIGQGVLWGMTSEGGKLNGGNIFSLNSDGTGFVEQHPFLGEGQTPYGQQLLAYGDGYLYGVVGFGGMDQGALYRMLPDGSNYTVVYYFHSATGNYPYGAVTRGVDGYLYGTASQGGSNGHGVIYKIKTDGSAYQVLHNFTGADGAFPVCALFQYSNGFLYGTTVKGGSFNNGTIFSIHPDGSGYTMMHNFTGTDGSSPAGGLTLVTLSGLDFFFGITSAGGTSGNGVIYRILTTGIRYEVRYTFNNTTGSNAGGGLLKIAGTNVILYGAERNSGFNNGGTVFAYNATNNTINLLHSFSQEAEYFPTAPLININGVLYGTTEMGSKVNDGVLYKMNTDGTGYQVLTTFPDKNSFGNLLYFNNIIYGLTTGSQVNTGYSDGTIYTVATNGTGYKTLHSFNDPGGYSPSGSLINAADGMLYGMTTLGGSGFSNGIIFSIKTDGSAYTPQAWLGNGPTEGNALGSLVQASNGNMYGLNHYGGPAFAGNVFMFNPVLSPNYQKLYNFCLAPGCGSYPLGSLTQASDGFLYGMTSQSGAANSHGAVFKIKTDGTGFTVLHTFVSPDGLDPSGSLIEGPDGYLYGMTPDGGTDGFGIIFKISKDGLSYKDIFDLGPGFGSSINGTHPQGSLLLGVDGKLYGMAYGGGSNWAGTIFRLNIDGSGFQVIYNFDGITGLLPLGSLIQDKSTGFLYGMTEQGGTNNFGTIFKIQTDGTNFQKLLDFTGINGKYPKGDLLLVPSTPMMVSFGSHAAQVVPETISGNKSFLIMYPNPAKNIVNISIQVPETGKVGLTLFDPTGRIVKQSVSQKSASTIWQQWDLSDMPAGIYLLKVQTVSRELTKTIIKQ